MGASNSFPVQPHYPVVYDYAGNTSAGGVAGGAMFRRNRANGQRIYHFTFINRTWAEFNAVEEFLALVGDDWFVWADLDNDSEVIKLVQASDLHTDQALHDKVSFSLELMEVET